MLLIGSGKRLLVAVDAQAALPAYAKIATQACDDWQMTGVRSLKVPLLLLHSIYIRDSDMSDLMVMLSAERTLAF